MSWLLVVVPPLTGALVGRALRVVLARPRRGIVLPTGACELALALAGAALGATAAVGAVPPRSLPALGVLAVLTVGGVATDLLVRRLPDVLTGPALVLGTVTAAALGGGSLLAGLALGAGLVVLFGSVRLLAPGALGGGDVKLVAALGPPLGAVVADAAARAPDPAGAAGRVPWEPVAQAALALPVIASLLLLTAAALRRRRALPFAPALLAAAWCEVVIVA